MPLYHYNGRKYDTGGLVTGERVAANKQSLAVLLRNEQVMPISISEASGKESAIPRLGRGVSAKTLALFTRQFSVMLDAGLPLVQCLSIMAEQQESQLFRQTLNQVREDVEAGSMLADALRKHPKVFDRLFVNMVAAGEAGGILDIILKRLSVFVEKAVKLKRAVVSASVYPLIIVAVAIIVVFVIMLWVIPVFATLFEGLNAPLPLPTRLVMWTSAALGQFILPVLVFVGLMAAGFRYYYKTEKGRLAIDRTILALPLFGDVMKKIAIARFSRTLSTLLSSGIPILEGLEITATTAGNVVIQNGLMQARKEISEGKTLVDPLKRMKIFPPMVTQVVAVGEQTGELDQMLDKMADCYEEESDAAIANFLTMLEPLMIIFLGVVIGGIVVSMYLPIFTLIGRLAAQ
jgi:type IV pilus assembly protein PilC